MSRRAKPEVPSPRPVGLRARPEPRGPKPALLAVVCLAASLMSGCGYSLAGRGSFLPTYIQIIGIPNFNNRTTFFNVEQILTQKVRAEFIGRGKYKVLPESTGVDAVLSGDITSVGIAPASFNQDQQASRYFITVTAKIEFRDLRANKVLWENPSMSFREEYQVTSATTAVDPNAFFGQEANALERVATDFARTLVSAILEAF
jgi:lipopolysaccharide assembly LptE-like protein